ncbi:hypothetical protein [Paracidovorax wautersii]|jgi:hypothetical protein|uniref:Uncharacterized protein n=1 Tax=Paracidovorax wautersii TaxID=1177982 RepID=A0A1I2F536_9BURK|nr:hypothetical protein [Paracidovorax wautersii]RYH69326.1 MAG: hypothetical protein EON54_02390 [Alcaligenaceae bacterium]SFF00554.1 hypothetical protein SAMN04489711_109159 [Paracidovorax wautersii]
MSFLTSIPLSHSSLVRTCLAAGVVFPDATPPISMGDLVVANAVYQHAGTDDFINPLPERDFSAIVIAYFTKNPERLSLEAMRAAFVLFLWDASNRRQHPRLDKLNELWSMAEADAQNAFLQLFVEQCVWIRRQAAGEFK